MNRRKFTENISKLILQMIANGDQPVFDRVFSPSDYQDMLYAKGRIKDSNGNWIVSNAKEVVTYKTGLQSAHCQGKAADIYFVVTNPDLSVEVDFNCDKTAELHRKYHDIWVSMGGKPIIESPTFRDLDHYEG